MHMARLRQPHPGRLTLAFMRSFLRRMYAKMIAGWPEPVRGQLIEVHLSSNGGRQARGKGAPCPSSPASSSRAETSPTCR
jgi:hypothetical protein